MLIVRIFKGETLSAKDKKYQSNDSYIRQVDDEKNIGSSVSIGLDCLILVFNYSCYFYTYYLVTLHTSITYFLLQCTIYNCVSNHIENQTIILNQHRLSYVLDINMMNFRLCLKRLELYNSGTDNILNQNRISEGEIHGSLTQGEASILRRRKRRIDLFDDTSEEVRKEVIGMYNCYKGGK